MIGSIISFIVIMVVAAISLIWCMTGKLPNNYDMFKSIKLVTLPSGEYEVHAYHGPFRKTVPRLEPRDLKWYQWYKVTSKLAVHRLDSPLATFDNKLSALKVIDKIRSTKVEYF